MRRLRGVVFVWALAIPAVASADIIHLKPRGTVEGTIVGEDESNYKVQLPDGGTTTIPKNRVASIEKTEPKSDTPKTDTPKSDTPKSDTPRSDTPKSDTPQGPAQPAGKDPAWSLPPVARLGGASTLPDISSTPAAFKKDLDGTIAGRLMPDGVERWVSEHAKSDAERNYVLYLMESLDDATLRKSLWNAWSRWGKPEQLEARLLELAGTDLNYARFDALERLKPVATWEKSFPLLLKLLKTFHGPSQNAACDLMAAIGRRKPPAQEQVDALLNGFKDPNVSPEVQDACARVLSSFARLGSVIAVTAVRKLYDDASYPTGKMRLLPIIVGGLDESNARERVLEVLQKPDGDVSLCVVALGLIPKCGDVTDVEVCRQYLYEGGSDPGPGSRRREAALTAITQLSHRSFRFSSADEVDRWWPNAQKEINGQAALISQIQGGGNKALEAVNRIATIYTRDARRALREAASSNSDSAVSSAAALCLINRDDKKAAGAVLDAFARARGDSKVAIARMLSRLAGSDAVPTGDADSARAWWQENRPEDLK